MRLRFAVLAATLAALVVLPASAVTAAPNHPGGLTINATPNPVNAGGGVFIYGQLQGTNVGGQKIRLYAHFPRTRGFRRIGSTQTNQFGFYDFTRPTGVVYTNRDWYTRGPSGARSRTVHERVYALVSIQSSATNVDTRHPVLFTGHVTPNHAGDRVYLQQERANGTWNTLKSDVLNSASNYSITYRWRIPDTRTVRVLLRRDDRNIASVSQQLTITVQQTQVPGFTINSSDQVIPYGGSANIYGVLDKKGTTTPEPSTNVSLWAKSKGQPHFLLVDRTTTSSDGSYSFTVHPAVNELYQVRTSFAPHRSTAVLFEGVHDLVTLSSSSSTSQVGGHIVLMGTVTPDKAGSKIFLQWLGGDGAWHDVASTRVRFNSTYQFGWTFGEPGMHEFRTRIEGDGYNVGAASNVAVVNVSGVAPVTSGSPGH